MKQGTERYLKAAACFLIFLAMQLVGGAIALLLANYQQIFSGESISNDSLMANPLWIGIGLLVSDVIVVLLLWVTMLIRRRPLPSKTPRMPYHWFVPLCTFILLSVGLNIVSHPLDLDDAGITKFFEGMRNSVVCLITLTLIGPIVEELVFREGILRQLKKAGLSSLSAIIISSVLFGLAHGNMAQFVMATLLGVVLGVLYERTGDIRLSAPAHILNNSFGVLLLYFPQIEEGFEKIDTFALVCGGLLLAVTAVWILKKWWDVSLTKIPPVPCK